MLENNEISLIAVINSGKIPCLEAELIERVDY